MKKLFDSDWLRAVQFFGNTAKKKKFRAIFEIFFDLFKNHFLTIMLFSVYTVTRTFILPVKFFHVYH